ncbi:MAG: restriction endonuclease [Bacteroidetes bacterium]|nr:restriction endonuclease [Bacteroidota bacterium]
MRTDRAEDGVKITPSQLRLLQEYHGEKGTPYFTLINNGVKFCEYVGVLQVGNLIIEVLPKTDASDDKNTWQQFLVTMLRKTGMLDIEQTGFASLKIIGNSILDLYFLLFLQEAKYLLQTGLVKKYRTTERNSFSLRGNLIFGKHVSKNIVHAERFYVRNSNYSYDNTYNGILVKTVKLIAAIGKPSIGAKAKSILVDLPECSDMLISESTFTKLVFDRKTDGYRNAMNIARLLLLNYHPDVRRGSNNVIALMFDMNLLWERYIFRTLKKALGEKYPCEYIVKEQVPTGFWKPQAGYIKTIRPDIVVYRSSRADEAFLVLDTKWKQPASNKPDDADLKQMLAYNLYKKSYRSALVYPGIGSTGVVEGNFQIAGHGGCSLVFLPLKAATGNIQLDLDNLLSLFAVLS